MTLLPSATIRVNAVIGTGHFLSHFYQLCLPPMFLAWQAAFGVSFAELGLSLALMSCATGLLQTPVGFLVDRYGARSFLVGGTLLDRKSTRLNSSHRCISYAVFCLK